MIRSVAWAACLLAASSLAYAQPYPHKPVRVIFPFAAGGAGDIIARTYGQKFAEKFGQGWVLDNRGGAGSTLGTDIVAKSAPDGYTLLLGSLTFAVSAATFAKLPYDPVRDFSPITPLGMAVSLLAVTPSLPANSVKELVALAKAKPGQLTFASAGTGSTGHLSGELFKRMTGIDMVHVPYKGSGPALPDLLAGRVHMIFEPAATMLPHVRAGRMRALGVTSAKRSAAAPEIPSLAEQGLEGYDVATWYGLLAPARTPRRVIETLHRAFAEFAARAEIRERMSAIAVEPMSLSPDEYARLIKRDIARWSEVARAAGVSL